MRNRNQILMHLKRALSFLKEQSGYDEETEALQDLIELVEAVE